MSALPESSLPKSSLRLFSPPPLPAGVAGGINQLEPRLFTIREAFEAFLKEKQKKKTTVEAFENACMHWEQGTSNPPEGCQHWGSGSGNPPICQITQEQVEEFVEKIMPPRVPSPATIVKVCRGLRTIFRRVGPAIDGNPQGRGILDKIPYFPLPKVPKSTPRTAHMDQLNLLYDACGVATWPRIGEIPPANFWRTSLVSFYNLGPRAWEFFCAAPHCRDESIPEGRLGWRWDKIDLERATIEYWSEKVSAWLERPLHAVVVAHLKSIWSDRSAVFPATKCRSTLYDEWKKIKTAAGVGVMQTRSRSNPDLDVHDLRRTCSSEWDWIHPMLGDWMIGHIPNDVGSVHYRNFARKARETLPDFPQPEAFLNVPTLPVPSRQKRLF